MRQSAAKKWTHFSARQWIDPTRCRFEWRAVFGPASLIRVRDALSDGGGELSARLLGIVPLARATGTEATRGELMRYLAELPWCPDAIIRNEELVWEAGEAGGAGLAVSARFLGVEARLQITLDGGGRIADIFAPDRPRSVGRAFVPTPWWGRFSDYRLHAGRWLPFGGEVGWVIDGRREAVWTGEILDWKMVE